MYVAGAMPLQSRSIRAAPSQPRSPSIVPSSVGAVVVTGMHTSLCAAAARAVTSRRIIVVSRQ
jgi:hypothetical protein